MLFTAQDGTAMTTPPATFHNILGPYRAQIDALDRQIVKLLCERFKVVHQVAGIKAEHNIPVMLPDRVQIVLDHVAVLAAEQGGNPDVIRKIYSEIIKIACDLESSLINQNDSKNLT
jgi:4-amino-4-deoxychorismate mutase